MKKSYKLILSVCLSTILMIGMGLVPKINAEGNKVLYEKVEDEIITAGLKYEKKTKMLNNGFVDIHVLIMDLQNENIDLDILRSSEEWGIKDQLTDMAKANAKVVGGINASFFDTSRNPTDILGVEYEQGNYSYIKENYNVGNDKTASIMVTKDNKIEFGFIGANIMITTEAGGTLYINSINGYDDLLNPNIFNINAMKDTTGLEKYDDLYKIVVEQEQIIKIVEPKVVATIPEDGYIITVNAKNIGNILNTYKVGMGIKSTIKSTIADNIYNMILSGGGKILSDSQVVREGLIVQPNARHPRTALGITADGTQLISMVVDGRGSSMGATHNELAGYLLEYNVSDAIHFDGGGSSVLISRELGKTNIKINNRPSDGVERRIINGLGFVTNAPEGKLNQIEVRANVDRVFINNSVSFEVLGYDEYYNPVEIDEKKIGWANQGIVGTWKDNIFTPTSAGKGEFTCYYDDLEANVSVVSIDKYIDLDIEPRVLRLDIGKTGSFEILGTDEDGYKSKVNNEDVSWDIVEGNIGEFHEGKFISNGNEGISKIRATVGGKELSAYVVVGNELVVAETFEDINISSVAYPETVIADAILTNKNVYAGDQAVQLNYRFDISKNTQAAYVVLEKSMIEKPIMKLGLNVYGNNSNHMLRGKIVDAIGKDYNITFAKEINWDGWKYVETDIPKDVKYPITVERIYVVALENEKISEGTIYFDEMIKAESYDISHLIYDKKEMIDDPLLTQEPESNDFKISIFGATSGRNRLLDELVLNKAYESVAGSDLTIFAGNTNVDESKISNNHIIWNNTYSIWDYDEVRIISLATGNGGMLKTDPLQWEKIFDDLNESNQKNIIIIANGNPLYKEQFLNKREGELLHQTLADYQHKTDKNIFYINASGYDFNVDYYEGIRYIDMNGLWYNIPNNDKINLNTSFYTANFYLNKNSLEYTIENLYPKVEIGE